MKCYVKYPLHIKLQAQRIMIVSDVGVCGKSIKYVTEGWMHHSMLTSGWNDWGFHISCIDVFNVMWKHGKGLVYVKSVTSFDFW